MTEGQIQERIGASTILFPPERRVGSAEIGMMREAGLTRLEVGVFNPPSHFNYHDDLQVKEVLDECNRCGMTITSFHCPYLDQGTEDEGLHRFVVSELVCSAKVAEQMGAEIYVCHYGFQPVERKVFEALLDAMSGSPMRFVVENGADVPGVLAFADGLGRDRMGFVLDIGHPRTPDGANPMTDADGAGDVIRSCTDQLEHMHVHGFVNGGDHQVPVTPEDEIAWGALFNASEAAGFGGTFMFEVASVAPVEETLEALCRFPAAAAELVRESPQT